MSLQSEYRALRESLMRAGKDGGEARELIKLSCKEDPLTARDRALTDDEAMKLRELESKRISGCPLQYLAGKWPFLDFELYVGAGVLIPRPDTESVALKAIEAASDSDSPVVLDLCSGSGCIAIAMKRAISGSAVTAVELSREAFVYLEKNCLELAPEIVRIMGDALCYHEHVEDASVDVIACNPPYVSTAEYEGLEQELYFEPKTALVADDDGYSFYEQLIPAYYPKLRDNGSFVFETGDKQAQRVLKMFLGAGYSSASTFEDCFGLVRGVIGKK